jgi:hypothetical protein
MLGFRYPIFRFEADVAKWSGIGVRRGNFLAPQSLAKCLSGPNSR